MLKGKTITIGITGSIAAFKIPLLIRQLQEKGANVRCMLTSNAKQFVSITTLENLTENPVFRDGHKSEKIEHVNLANTTDLFILAPLTANTLSKIALGLADNLITSVMLATRKPVLMCPAMNDGMWENEILQKNVLKILQINNFFMIKPDQGKLACGTEGIGRLAGLEQIVIEAEKIFTPQILENKTILVSLGATREQIDPVRFISNSSSGKMGYAFAESAYLMGAKVKIISGQTDIESLFHFEITKTTTCAEMQQEITAQFTECAIFVSAAAVGDFKTDTKKQKIKSGSSVKIKFSPTTDILKTLVKIKQKEQKIIGFALETGDLEKNARKKLKSKKIDFIIANNLENLGTDDGGCILISKDQTEIFENQPKRNLAFKIWREVT